MNAAIADSLALLSAIAGWFYLFYSGAAARLAAIESPALNRRRQKLRRVCGVMMFLLGVAIFAGCNSIDADRSPKTFVAVWAGAMVLLLCIMALVYIDLRLTLKIMHAGKKEDHT
jgi:drug/metabolite transporter (DMT)-like permease